MAVERPLRLARLNDRFHQNLYDCASNLMRWYMRTTVSIDDELFDKAIQLCEPGIEKSKIIRQAMRTSSEFSRRRGWLR